MDAVQYLEQQPGAAEQRSGGIEITGLQLQSWASGPKMVRFAQAAAERLDGVWITDQLQSRSASVLLAAIASQVGCSVGTAVTFPFGRNVLEQASNLATIGEFLDPSRRVRMGIGSGGVLVDAVIPRSAAVMRVRETIECTRRLWAGETVALGEFGATCDATGFRETANCKLAFPVEREIEAIVAGTGPKILEMAGEVADGIICASNFPTHSLGAFRSGQFASVSNLDAVDRGRARSERQHFARIYGINVSVARDGDAARRTARTQAALIVGAQPEKTLLTAGIEPDEIAPVKQAFRDGLGVAGAAEKLSPRAAAQLVIAGTPDECIGDLVELLGHAAGAGFTEAYIGAPVGPDPAEAIGLITNELLPRLGER